MTGGTDTAGQRGGGGRRRRWLIELLVVVLLLTGVHLWQTRGAAAGAAPPLTGRLLSGRDFDLAALRGRPVLVQFWATWCPVCRLELGTLDALARDHAVVAVALEDTSPAGLQAFLKAHGVAFPVLPDADGALARRFGVRGVPTSFVVDPAGRIRFVEVGYTTGIGLRLRLWWAGRTGAVGARTY